MRRESFSKHFPTRTHSVFPLSKIAFGARVHESKPRSGGTISPTLAGIFRSARQAAPSRVRRGSLFLLISVCFCLCLASSARRPRVRSRPSRECAGDLITSAATRARNKAVSTFGSPRRAYLLPCCIGGYAFHGDTLVAHTRRYSNNSTLQTSPRSMITSRYRIASQRRERATRQAGRGKPMHFSNPSFPFRVLAWRYSIRVLEVSTRPVSSILKRPLVMSIFAVRRAAASIRPRACRGRGCTRG